jgi:lipopolysaccharide export system protein LptA
MKKIMIMPLLFLVGVLSAEEVDIKANHFYADDITKLAYFEGDATITQGKNSFHAVKVIVYFNSNRKAIKYEATGEVQFDLIEKEIHYKGKADKITYAPNDSKYYFVGDVVLNDLTNNRKIVAEEILLDLKTGLADIKGSNNQPVHFRFEIEDRK